MFYLHVIYSFPHSKLLHIFEENMYFNVCLEGFLCALCVSQTQINNILDSNESKDLLFWQRKKDLSKWKIAQLQIPSSIEIKVILLF